MGVCDEPKSPATFTIGAEEAERVAIILARLGSRSLGFKKTTLLVMSQSQKKIDDQKPRRPPIPYATRTCHGEKQ